MRLNVTNFTNSESQGKNDNVNRDEQVNQPAFSLLNKNVPTTVFRTILFSIKSFAYRSVGSSLIFIFNILN